VEYIEYATIKLDIFQKKIPIRYMGRLYLILRKDSQDIYYTQSSTFLRNKIADNELDFNNKILL